MMADNRWTADKNILFFSKRNLVIKLPVGTTITVQSFTGLTLMVPEIIGGGGGGGGGAGG